MDAPQKIKPFLFHGCDLHPISGDEWIGACIFCQHDKERFHVNKENGKWDCKLCGKSGNTYSFLQELHELSFSNTTEEDYQYLSNVRGINTRTFRRYKVCKHHIRGDYTIPTYSLQGKLVNLHRWVQTRLFGTPGCAQHPIGLNFLDEYQDILWLVEGQWDCMALYQALRAQPSPTQEHPLRNGKTLSRADTEAVLGVPGANIFKPKWLEYFDNRDVVICFDNDDAGRAGIERITGMVQNMDNNCRSLHVVQWLDTDRFNDIGDLLTNGS